MFITLQSDVLLYAVVKTSLHLTATSLSTSTVVGGVCAMIEKLLSVSPFPVSLVVVKSLKQAASMRRKPTEMVNNLR